MSALINNDSVSKSFGFPEIKDSEKSNLISRLQNLESKFVGSTDSLDCMNEVRDVCEKVFEEKKYENRNGRGDLGPYRKIKKNDPVIEKDCYICLESFKEGSYKRTLVCNHTFHKKCVDKWFNKHDNDTCPICRKNQWF
jgi:hypothetical protein